MEITKALIAKKHTFSKCVICKCYFGEDDKNPQSDEHLIPEFLGGKFKVGILCKVCNNAMGSGFEDRLAQSFLGKAHANKYQIKGKSTKIPNSPLVGDYQYRGKKIFFTPDYKIKLHSSLDCTQNEDGGFTITGHIDASDLEESKKKACKSVIRAFRKKAQNVDEEKIYKQVCQIIDNSIINVENNPVIHGNITIDFNDIESLLLKIAYEALCIHLGEIITNDEYFDVWRTSLQEQKIEPAIQYGYDNFFKRIAPIVDAFPISEGINFDEFERGEFRDNTLIIFSGEAIFVRCIGIWIKFRTNLDLATCLYEHSVTDNKLRFYDSNRFMVRLLNKIIYRL